MNTARKPIAREFIRAPEIAQQLGISIPTLNSMIAVGTLPRPVRLAPKIIGWPACVIRTALDGLLYGDAHPRIEEKVQ